MGLQHISDVILYDPTTRISPLVGRMARPRLGHSATLLPNGKILFAGGGGGGYMGKIFSLAELYDPIVVNRISRETIDDAYPSTPMELIINYCKAEYDYRISNEDGGRDAYTTDYMSLYDYVVIISSYEIVSERKLTDSKVEIEVIYSVLGELQGQGPFVKKKQQKIEANIIVEKYDGIWKITDVDPAPKVSAFAAIKYLKAYLMNNGNNISHEKKNMVWDSIKKLERIVDR
jgi:hypothetical protein